MDKTKCAQCNGLLESDAVLNQVNLEDRDFIQNILRPQGEMLEYGDYKYNGFVYHWTGWKPAIGNDTIAAQWVAYGDGVQYFVSNPGIYSSFTKGSSFDIMALRGQQFMTKKNIANRELRRSIIYSDYHLLRGLTK